MILNIDTAVDTAGISIAVDGNILQQMKSTNQKEHAAFLQPGIQSLFKQVGINLHELDAVAVSEGPGSYTGLRVGMASAKGLCYGLKKPLLTIPTLEVLAFEAILQRSNQPGDISPVFCAMIDARRSEVFTAIYDAGLNPVLPPCSMILDPNSFADFLLRQQVLFFGNGAEKWKKICNNSNALFYHNTDTILAMSKLSQKKYELKDFADLAYAQPFYLKDFNSRPLS